MKTFWILAALAVPTFSWATPMLADVIPSHMAGCQGLNAGDACTASDGSASTCQAVDLKVPGPTMKTPKTSRLVCPRTGVIEGRSSKPLMIAMGCALAAVAIVIAGRGWMSPTAASAKDEAKSEAKKE